MILHTAALGVTEILAAEQPKGPEFGKASPLGLLVIVLLLVGTALLIRSMNRQLKKLPTTFDSDHPEPDQAFDEGTDAVPDAGEQPARPADAPPSEARPTDDSEERTADESTAPGT
ncbi:hypothetical protein [Gordonia soli]|uniref:Uncharacterized protein n=1 Tax=Gordonia soli NBRC 108243 TaxID=1223545 RepID=M0QPH1_9ACTN|nr:hypothetical protein [Gordonia soli]GAC70458.1 hypothetical protein GS4_35_00340 [Gordonia soli NBRC 108243]